MFERASDLGGTAIRLYDTEDAGEPFDILLAESLSKIEHFKEFLCHFTQKVSPVD
jgi:hypothetical protein